MALLLSALPLSAQTTGVATVDVVNYLTMQPVAGATVLAKKRVGDTLTWVAQRTTDAAGRATFQLAGLGKGTTYVFLTNVFGTGYAQSRDVGVVGGVRLYVGTLAVSLVAGGTRAPQANALVTVKERLADSTLKWVGQATTDGAGKVILDPAGLGSGRVYALEAKSPWDGTTKRSNDIRDRGAMTFAVGNAPLTVTLADALSLQPLPQQTLTVRERLADGTLKWIVDRATDAAGRAVFDLAGLGEGRTYVLRAKVFNGTYSESSDITAAGDFLFKVGTLQVTVVSGSTGAAMPGVLVSTYELLADGTKKWVNDATTDARATIRYDLAGLGRGRRYQLRTKSPLDGSTKWSNTVTETGRFTFVVGNAPLVATLKNGLSNAVLANKIISARERLADGTTRWVMDRTTDTAGKATFGLDGLGEGRKYYLTTTPYDAGTATSRDITAPGEFAFNVGMLEVAVVNPYDGSVLPNLAVTAREQLADGTKYVTGGTTDAQGIIRFDLPGLGEGKSYVLEAKGPIDGATKRSDLITATGRITFRVGSAPLVVTLVNALSGDKLPGVKITVQERTGPDTLVWVTARTTDTAGRALFDLAGLGNGRTYVLSAVPYNGGTAYSDDLRTAAPYEFRVGSVEVALIKGADGSVLANYKVSAYEKLADGKLSWVTSGNTDLAGVIRFDFRGLKTGKTYVLEAKSPLDDTTKRSQEIKAVGKYVFRVGNAPVVVTVRNALSGAALAGLSITAKERTATGSRWVRQVTTDAGGQAIFDLDGLTSGRVYFFVCEPYGAGAVESPNVTRAGPFDFPVGALEVLVLSGADGQPLADTEVTAYEVLPLVDEKKDKNWKWSRYGHTDANGIIRFDLPGLGSGRTYILEAHSPVDGSHKYTDPLTQPGRLTFVVGNAALRVTLMNGLTGEPVVGAEISAYEVFPDGNWAWASWVETDAFGVGAFDLDGLGSGRVYILDTDPYDAGAVQSPPIEMTGDIVMRVGTVPVTVIDGDGDLPMAGVHIDVYEIDDSQPDDEKKKKDGPRLIWAKHADTDANGMIQFDIEGLSQTTPDSPVDGRRFVLVAWQPFGAKKAYYSGVLTHEGPIEFRITREGDYPLDAKPPSVSVTSPVDGANVDVSGFTLIGFADDNATLTQVVVTVTDPVKGTVVGQATYSQQTAGWTFPVSASMITLGQTVSIAVRAYDQANNEATQTLSVRVIVDTAAPVIAITSHQDGAEVEKTGFLLAGTARDDIAVTSLVASVIDPVLGVTVNRQPVDVAAAGGQWTFTVLNGQMTQGQMVTVALEGRDAKGNRGTASIALLVVAVDFEGTHLINRITFGATPQLYAEVASIGPDAFLAQQLAPQTVDDSAFTALIGAQPVPTTAAELQRYALLHMINSRRQLREVLTQFWDNHFNTDLNKTKVVAYELSENNALRQNALGRFRDLLDVSARGPAMMIYLDNATSQRANPNENYGRELLELMTLGVDGGYTQRDVEQVAKAFTGWQVQNGQFFFNAADHDTGAKTVLGQTLPAGRGIEDGVQVLDILARHPSTARFLCTKLSQLFVSDRPPAALVARCAQAYLASDGQIGTTVASILRSPEFGDPLYFRAKIKTPLEFVVGVVRNFGATTNTGDLIAIMDDMGMRLFQNPVPTGWSETGDDWMNSNALIQRMRFVNQVAYAPQGGANTWVQLRPFFTNSGFTTADGITGFLFQMLFHHDYTDLDRAAALDILTNAGTSAFDITAPNADARLRRLVGTVMSYPGYEFQ